MRGLVQQGNDHNGSPCCRSRTCGLCLRCCACLLGVCKMRLFLTWYKCNLRERTNNAVAGDGHDQAIGHLDVGHTQHLDQPQGDWVFTENIVLHKVDKANDVGGSTRERAYERVDKERTKAGPGQEKCARR